MADSHELLAALQTRAHDTRAIVRAMIASRLADGAEGSWHPYGFHVSRLLEQGAAAVRLHVWPAGRRRRQVPDWPIHSHPWQLQSHVLCGSLRNIAYGVSDGGSAAAHRLYTVAYDGSYSVLRRTSTRVSTTLLHTERQTAGGWYDVPEGSFHATEVDQGFSATIVLTVRTGSEQPFVVGDEDGNAEYRFERQPSTRDEVVALYQRLNEALAAIVARR